MSFDKDSSKDFKTETKNVEKLMRDFEKNKNSHERYYEKSPKLDVIDEYAKMYEDAVQYQERNKDYQIHIKEKKRHLQRNMQE